MTRFHARLPFVLALALATVSPLAAQAAEDPPISAAFVFDFMGSQSCEPVPPGMPDEAVDAVLAQAVAGNDAPLRADMEGFMQGERIGVSVFGTRTEHAGFAVVSSVLGPHPSGGHASLCLAMIQLGDVPVRPATYPVVGAAGLETASPGDVLVVGWVVRLESTGRQGDNGRDIYRLASLGEAQVAGGSFTLVSVDGDRMEARVELTGEVHAQDGSGATAFSMDASSWGERGLDSIPSLTINAEAP